MSSDADHVMLVGITCGLSAPYVAGQIDHAIKQVSLFHLVLSAPSYATVELRNANTLGHGESVLIRVILGQKKSS